MGDFRSGRWSLGAAILAASSCCLGPIVFALLGIGGAGALATLGAYRPYLLAGTTALVGTGYYFAYRTPRAGADACGCEHADSGRPGRVWLWIATALVLLVSAAPPTLGWWTNRASGVSRSTADAALARATIVVVGIDCAACAGPIRAALTKVGGLGDLTLDVANHSVSVTYEPRLGRLEAYVAAINDLGYEASLPGASDRPSTTRVARP